MMTFINILIVLALIGVVIPLGLGMVGLARGGEFNARNGNRFMRWRVTMQAVAVGMLFIGFMYKMSHPG